MDKSLRNLAIIFVAITIGFILMGWTTQQTIRATQLHKLYLLQKNRADAAARVIDECWEQYNDFGDTVVEGDTYYDWQVAEELCEKYDK